MDTNITKSDQIKEMTVKILYDSQLSSQDPANNSKNITLNKLLTYQNLLDQIKTSEFLDNTKNYLIIFSSKDGTKQIINKDNFNMIKELLYDSSIEDDVYLILQEEKSSGSFIKYNKENNITNNIANSNIYNL